MGQNFTCHHVTTCFGGMKSHKYGKNENFVEAKCYAGALGRRVRFYYVVKKCHGNMIDKIHGNTVVCSP
jgi:hypothetical protein